MATIEMKKKQIHECGYVPQFYSWLTSKDKYTKSIKFWLNWEISREKQYYATTYVQTLSIQ